MAVLKGSISDNTGKPISGVSIQVYLADTTTPASLYSDKAMTIGTTNPLTTELDGSFMCYCAPGYYDLVPSKAGVTFDTTDFEDEFVVHDSHTASDVVNVPAGDIAATNVQAALNELDSEKIPLTQKGAANGVASLNGSGKVVQTALNADAATSATTAGFATTAGDADTVDSYHASALRLFLSQSVVTGSRAVNTVYQNTTGKPMFIVVSVANATAGAQLNAYSDSNATPTVIVSRIEQQVSNWAMNLVFMVPPSYYYKLAGSAGWTLDFWTEWY